MKRSEDPKTGKPHSVEVRLRWSPGALRALVAAAAAACTVVASFWREIAAFFGLLALLIIVFTPLMRKGSPEDVSFAVSMVGPDLVFSCDLTHSLERPGSPCPGSARVPPPFEPSSLTLAGEVLCLPRLFCEDNQPLTKKVDGAS